MADIHPIRNKADYEQALAEIDAIIQQNPDGNTPDNVVLLSGLFSVADMSCRWSKDNL